MDCFSCLSLIFDEETPAEREHLKQAILTATQQVHADYAQTLTERTATYYYKYNGPSSFNKSVNIVTKHRALSSHKPTLNVLAKMYHMLNLQGYAGIIIQHDTISIILNNYGRECRRSIPLYCTLDLSRVAAKKAT